MSGKTVSCAACDAAMNVPDSGEAYLSGVVLGAVNGQPYLEWEKKNLCPRHAEKLETYIEAMHEEMS